MTKTSSRIHEPMSREQLMWMKFKHHKLAVASGVLLIILYLIVIFANFMAPYPIDERYGDYIFAPPQRIRLFKEARLIGPHVRAIKQERDPETLRRIYVKTDEVIPIRFFVHGHEYRFWGLIKTDLHLFGAAEEDQQVFLFGTDRLGKDMLSRMLFAIRISLTVGMVSVFISLVFGSVVGTISGYYGGHVDMIVQRVIEFLQGFPRVPLWMALSAALPPEWSSIKIFFGITVLLAFLNWTGLARGVRSKILAYREEDFTMSAKLIGANDKRIILVHLLPLCLSHIIVVATLSIPATILSESSLSFLGLGIRPPMVSLGVLLREAQNVRSVLLHPWLLLPGLFIVLPVLAFNFLGDGLRDAADPYSL
jgi:peptide/nickel transport system permease protein